MVKKIDASFGRAARDRAEREVLLKRLKRERKVAVWRSFLSLFVLVAGAFIPLSPTLIFRETPMG